MRVAGVALFALFIVYFALARTLDLDATASRALYVGFLVLSALPLVPLVMWSWRLRALARELRLLPGATSSPAAALPADEEARRAAYRRFARRSRVGFAIGALLLIAPIAAFLLLAASGGPQPASGIAAVAMTLAIVALVPATIVWVLKERRLRKALDL